MKNLFRQTPQSRAGWPGCFFSWNWLGQPDFVLPSQKVKNLNAEYAEPAEVDDSNNPSCLGALSDLGVKKGSSSPYITIARFSSSC